MPHAQEPGRNETGIEKLAKEVTKEDIQKAYDELTRNKVVKLTYFKQSGKYYSTGEYETKHSTFHEAVHELQLMLIAGDNPGLNERSIQRNHFDTVAMIFDVPHLFRAHDVCVCKRCDALNAVAKLEVP